MPRRGAVGPVALAALGAVACGQDSIRVVAIGGGDGGDAAPLAAAIERFVGAGRDAAAFAALVAEAEVVRPRLDETGADEVERRLVVLALGPVRAAAGLSPAAQADALATTVWPFALRGRYAAPTVQVDDRRPAALLVGPGEAAAAYLERICDGPLALECRETVPEVRAEVVGAVAIARLGERARAAIAGCTTCVDDPAGRAAIAGWGELAAAAARARVRAERDGDPDNWPVAGTAAGPWSAWPLVVLERDGDLIVAGQPVVGAARLAALRALGSPRLGLDVPPDAALGRVGLVLADLAAAGVREVEVAARDGSYPHARRGYRLDLVGRAPAVNIRDLDSVQVWLRAIDARVGPGQPVRAPRPRR
ncbi:MAG: hypothetical protein KA190_27915 [Kofleriaceae bacterium]|nr:hypothetical protein [Kofleriaceae bacterium]